MKRELRSMKQRAVGVLGDAKKYLQRFQSPLLEIMHHASPHTIDQINNSPNRKGKSPYGQGTPGNVFVTS
jgi:hypothetical protein